MRAAFCLLWRVFAGNFIWNNGMEKGISIEGSQVILAAAYVRMSTDHQKYSTENQMAAIREYAARHNMEITSIYEDDGRSGLNISGRKGLKQLIQDVESKTKEFSSILVLDVTRWGRFPDPDEAAHYEYICRGGGYDIRYVAEQFANDGSMASAVMKSVKRVMAGEYSRELSKKVFRGQCHLIKLGFRQGGHAGYGLRRMMVDEQGNIKGELLYGQCKSLQTDRVILVPGPAEEVEIVRWMYTAFIEEGYSEASIAAQLNKKGILSDLGREWTRGTVHEVLSNEKYIGNNVFNRISFKLKEKRQENKPEEWIRLDSAFEAIIEPRLFYTAQGIIRARSIKLSNEEMLDKLKSLREKKGWLSGIIIDEQDNMPSSSSYQHRFGSLVRAYELIGYTPDRDYRYIEINRHLRKFYAEIVEDTIRKIKELGGRVHREVTSDLIYINNEIKVSVIICRCLKTKTGASRWKLQLDSGLEPDITIAIRMDEDNVTPLDYYLLPAIDVENPKMRLRENNGLALDAYRFDDLELFFMLTERVPIKEAA